LDQSGAAILLSLSDFLLCALLGDLRPYPLGWEVSMPSIFVFDAYGTLLNVHAAIGHYRAEAGPEADRLSEVWRTKQLEYSWTLTLAGHYMDFWTLTERALDYALARVPSVDKALKARLLDAYFKLDAFADALPALRALKAKGHKTGILSNGSPDMLKGAVGAAGLASDLDAVLSVDVLKMFKPRPEVYGLVTDHFKCAPDDVTFASSNRWDVMGAAAFGFRPMWINRSKMPDEYPDFPPERVLKDLSALATVA
jgi:2-haloacid dehalogenase